MAGRLTDAEREDRRMSEKTLNARVLYRAKKYGWRVVRIQRSMVGGPDGQHRTGTTKGFPDLMMFREAPNGSVFDTRPRIIFVELKKELGHLSPPQVEWANLISLAGGFWAEWRPSDLRLGRIEGELNRG